MVKTCPLIVVLMVMSGCLIQGNSNNRPQINLDEHDIFATSFADCSDALGGWEVIDIIHNNHDDSVPIKNKYDFENCSIYVGFSRKSYLGRLASSNLNMENLKLLDAKDYAGSDAVKNFMDLNSVTCNARNDTDNQKKIRFKFPIKNKHGKKIGHKNYQYIDFTCRLAHSVRKRNNNYIGLSVDRTKKSLHFDVMVGRQYYGGIATYHFFDTDSDGIIKRHTRIRGQQAAPEIILDNYKLQQ